MQFFIPLKSKSGIGIGFPWLHEKTNIITEINVGTFPPKFPINIFSCNQH